MYFFTLLCLICIETNLDFDNVQIPFDAEGQIYEIDSLMAQQISFFEDYSKIRRAFLFLEPDSSYVIEIYTQKDKVFLRKRIGVSEETVLEIQKEIAALQTQKKTKVVYDRSGYGRFLRNSFLFAYGVQAPLTAIAFTADDYDFRSSTAVYMLSSAASFFIPLMLTKKCDVSKAHADLYLWGGIHGLYIAGALSSIVDIKFYERGGALITVSGSVIGEYIGFQSVNKFSLSLGRGSMIYIISDFTGLSAAGILGLIDNWQDPLFNYKHYLGASLIGFGGGIATGALLTKNIDLADGDPAIFANCGIVGALSLPIILTWFDGPGDNISEKIYISAGLTGLGLGSYVGHRIVKNKNFTENAGDNIVLGGLAGALTGAGCVFLMKSDDSKVYYTAALAGDIIGALVTARLINPGDSEKHSRLRFYPETMISLALSSVCDTPTRGPLVSFSF
ncbi:MAG TPA: hypothetical protein ENI34_00985 [candidate division WOR-3 bacterium]|uniref:Uncharacterized protein n=1 Tax=candidate division WOR-3 bacterium TaxID=2052148 RepID=A0A9C9EKY5_UNCW3|nr:hypothetical protein [candidate division WOR-3 bacterium]